jgi:hypothetical protein
MSRRRIPFIRFAGVLTALASALYVLAAGQRWY